MTKKLWIGAALCTLFARLAVGQDQHTTEDRDSHVRQTILDEIDELREDDMGMSELLASFDDVTMRDTLIGLVRPPLYEIRPRITDLASADIEPFPARAELIKDIRDPLDLERVIGDSDFLPAEFLVEAARVQASVCRIVFKRYYIDDHGYRFRPGDGYGTGFMVSPTALMTNNHVIPSAEFARKYLRVEFNYQRDLEGVQRQVTTYEFGQAGIFTTDADLDYTLIELAPNPGDATPNPGDRWGYSLLAATEQPPFYQRMRLNIVQHPNGGPKQIAIRGNRLQGRAKAGFRDRSEQQAKNFVLYTTDTKPGSSGSPVFNDAWRLVALHHAAGEHDGQSWTNNEGVLLSAVADDIRRDVGDGLIDESVLRVIGLNPSRLR